MLYRLDSVGYFKEVAEDVFEGYRFVIMTFVPHNSKPEYSLFLSKRYLTLYVILIHLQTSRVEAGCRRCSGRRKTTNSER